MLVSDEEGIYIAGNPLTLFVNAKKDTTQLS
jgi:hypothetical protein